MITSGLDKGVGSQLSQLASDPAVAPAFVPAILSAAFFPPTFLLLPPADVQLGLPSC